MHKLLKKYRIVFLLFLSLLEGGLLFHYYGKDGRPSVAYIIKNGQSYVLFWKGEEDEFVSKTYSYLQEAIDFGKTELGLEIGPNPITDMTVQSVWTRSEIGKKMVFWTTEQSPIPNRLTFHRPYEASLFLQAVKAGAYSTSPYGHSLSMVRVNHSN